MSAAPGLLIPQSPDELWERVVLPHVEEELRRISSTFPESILPPDFQNAYLRIAEQNYRDAVPQKDFHQWAGKMKNWQRWAHGLISYDQINPTHLKSEWNRLCKKEPSGDGFIFTGQVPEAVKKVAWSLKPRDIDYQEFFDTVLNEMCVNFMRRYFSSFQEPIEAWLYELAKSSAQDHVKTWVPGMRLPNEEDRPTGIDSIDEVQKRRKGEPRKRSLAETLTDRDEAAERARALAEQLRAIHAREGEAAKISDATIELFYKQGYTEREIAKSAKDRKVRVKDVKKILDDNCARMALIARQLGITRRTGREETEAPE